VAPGAGEPRSAACRRHVKAHPLARRLGPPSPPANCYRRFPHLARIFHGSVVDHDVVGVVAVSDIDTIVKQVRYTGWKETQEGDRTVRKELRQVLKKFGLPIIGPLFDNAYAYVSENY